MLSDLRYASRALRKNPGFTLVAILSLALGIGANAAIFSLADGLLLRPLPVPHSSEIMDVQSLQRGDSLGGLLQYAPVSYPDYRDLRDRSKSFTGLAASEYLPLGFATDSRAVPQMKYGVLVSGNFFQVMEVRPLVGRLFSPDEDRVPGRDAVAVLGEEVWRTEFGADPRAIGKSVLLNGIACTIIGVTPASFTGPYVLLRGALYVPFAMAQRLVGDTQPNILERRGERSMFVHGRLKPGVGVAEAEAEARVISRQLAEAHPDTNRTLALLPARDIDARFRENPLDAYLVVVLAALAAVVLLIACANVMNLMLSRGRARAREIAVRLAIGAGRARLVRQFLSESLLIGLAGGTLGLVVAQAGADLFSQIRIPSDLPVVLDFGLNPRVLLFTLAVSLVSVMVFGLVPALRTTKPDLTPALKAGAAETGRRSRFLGRNALVVGQVAGSLLLLIFASQAYRGAAIVLAAPAGFRTDHLLTAGFDPSLARSTPAQAREFFKKLLDGARRLPAVKGAALSQMVPLLPGGDQPRVIPEGVQLPPGVEAINVLSNTVTPDYFAVMDIPIVEGRGFQETDRTDTPRVAIVNELFAHKYYPKGSAIGRRFRLNSTSGEMVQIVGVARQSKYAFPVEPPLECIYQALEQNPQTGMTLVLHTSIAPRELAAPLRSLVRSIDSGQPILGVRTMDEIFDQRAHRTLAVLIGAIAGMGVLGLVLALVGLYGLMTYRVGLRQREIGIRMAIGADRAGVLKMVMKQGAGLAGGGVVIGTLLWLLASRPLMTLVSARSFSWSLLVLVALGLAGAAMLGAYIPARRASHLDPNLVLRQE